MRIEEKLVTLNDIWNVDFLNQIEEGILYKFLDTETVNRYQWGYKHSNLMWAIVGESDTPLFLQNVKLSQIESEDEVDKSVSSFTEDFVLNLSSVLVHKKKV